MQICVIIPAHNEADKIGSIVGPLVQKNLHVLVIDDGSTDKTKNIANNKGAVVICHQEKKGKGSSLQEGFTYALEKGFDGVITMDGDGQHDVGDVDGFIHKAENTPECVVSGNRMSDSKDMPLVRRLTNRVMSFFISVICKQEIPDTQCGFRFISSKILRDIRLSSRDFEIETEVLVQASKKGYKITSVPVKTIYDNEKSKINPFVDTMRFFAYIFRELFSSSKN